MSSYAHHIRRLELFGDVIYRLTWTVDHKYPSSRSRFPRIHTRDTDEAGARRFAKKWGISMPLETTE